MCDPKSHLRCINKGILWRNNMNSRVIPLDSGIRAPPTITPGCISVLTFYLPDLHSALFQFVSDFLPIVSLHPSVSPASLHTFIVCVTVPELR